MTDTIFWIGWFIGGIIGFWGFRHTMHGNKCVPITIGTIFAMIISCFAGYILLFMSIVGIVDMIFTKHQEKIFNFLDTIIIPCKKD